MGNVTRKELGDTVAKNTGLTATNCQKTILHFCDLVTKRLIDGRPIELRGFGSLTPGIHKGSTKRNPRTGEPVQWAGNGKVKWRPGQEFMKKFNERGNDGNL